MFIWCSFNPLHTSTESEYLGRPAPPIIFECHKLPQQIIYYWKGNLTRATAARDTIRQNENLYFKKRKKLYRIIRLFPHWRKFVPEIVPFWLKNQNQRVHAGGLMRGEAYVRGLYVE